MPAAVGHVPHGICQHNIACGTLPDERASIDGCFPVDHSVFVVILNSNVFRDVSDAHGPLLFWCSSMWEWLVRPRHWASAALLPGVQGTGRTFRSGCLSESAYEPTEPHPYNGPAPQLSA